TSDDFWRGKGIHYRMHPDNVDVLELASGSADPEAEGRSPVAAVLSNNHVLDWGYEGLEQTIETLGNAGLAPVGAGEDADAAAAPVAFDMVEGRRLVVFAYASKTSGVPAAWAARPDQAGVNLLPDYGRTTLDAVVRHIQSETRESDLVVFSVHWGGNWSYDVHEAQRRFAHALIERAGVDVVHGHSSHHVKGLEVHRDRLILYGCGDLITDYEGIGGHERFRPELSLLFFPSLDAETGELASLELVPMRLDRMRLQRADREQATWLRDTLREHSRGVEIERTDADTLRVTWK
ncbi:MAG: CapA family protein, partial [Phycisphaeraceae bacterium]